MRITAEEFWPTLPIVLRAISQASFVSVDLEMTGIRAQPSSTKSKLTLAEAYQEAKAAACKYNIVEFGLTCIKYDDSKESYITQTFNFPLNPRVSGKDGAHKALARLLDRQITISQSSLDFLEFHGFDLAKVLNEGVPYLSESETRMVGPGFFENPGKSSQNGPINIDDHDQETRMFYDETRRTIRFWLERGEENFLNIENPYNGRLNGLQIRLIRQLLDTEFPNLRARLQCNYFMQILKHDDEGEQKFGRDNLAVRRDILDKQAGFLIVIRGLVGGEFARHVNPSWLGKTLDSKQQACLMVELNALEAQCRRQQPVLVGHNQLYDLCFLYQTFLGPLPDQVFDFKRKIHAVFPRIVDTKYLLTRGGHEMLPDMNLEECYASIRDSTVPPIESEPGLGFATETLHEAGYDSHMTGVVFIRLSYSLYLDAGNHRFIGADAIETLDKNVSPYGSDISSGDQDLLPGRPHKLNPPNTNVLACIANASGRDWNSDAHQRFNPPSSSTLIGGISPSAPAPRSEEDSKRKNRPQTPSEEVARVRVKGKWKLVWTKLTCTSLPRGVTAPVRNHIYSGSDRPDKGKDGGLRVGQDRSRSATAPSSTSTPSMTKSQKRNQNVVRGKRTEGTDRTKTSGVASAVKTDQNTSSPSSGTVPSINSEVRPIYEDSYDGIPSDNELTEWPSKQSSKEEDQDGPDAEEESAGTGRNSMGANSTAPTDPRRQHQIPDWDSEFFKVFGNKIRVWGGLVMDFNEISQGREEGKRGEGGRKRGPDGTTVDRGECWPSLPNRRPDRPL